MKLKSWAFSIPILIVVVCGSVNHTLGHDFVVPASEREKAKPFASDAPTHTKLIESITVLGSVSLQGEFENLDGRILRTRHITILPGGQVAVHQHDSRPGVAYILEGELIEHRNDLPNPITRRVGTVAFEKTGVVHWWKNQTSRKAKVLVVDIVSQETK